LGNLKGGSFKIGRRSILLKKDRKETGCKIYLDSSSLREGGAEIEFHEMRGIPLINYRTTPIGSQGLGALRGFLFVAKQYMCSRLGS
jgi:hypothetical protein